VAASDPGPYTSAISTSNSDSGLSPSNFSLKLSVTLSRETLLNLNNPPSFSLPSSNSAISATTISFSSISSPVPTVPYLEVISSAYLSIKFSSG
jgi:hypothetical protein